MPDFETFEHPDPNFPDFWARRSLDIGDGLLAKGNLTDADTFRRVFAADIGTLVGKGYTEDELVAALDRATKMRAAIGELEDYANGAGQ